MTRLNDKYLTNASQKLFLHILNNYEAKAMVITIKIRVKKITSQIGVTITYRDLISQYHSYM